MIKRRVPVVAPVEVVTDLPTEVAQFSEYQRDSFFVGQTVTILDEFVMNEEEMVYDDGEELTTLIKNKLRKLQKEINSLIAKRELVGQIFRIEGDSLLIDFGKQYSFTSDAYPMNEVFPDKKTFFSFQKSLCGYQVKEGGITDGLVEFISCSNNESVESKCKKFADARQSMISSERSIQDYIRSINDYRKSIQDKKLIMALKRDEIENFAILETKDYNEYIKKIYRNPDVKSIKMITYSNENCICVTTNPLQYHDSVGHSSDRTPFGITMKEVNADIGEYKFLIFKSGRTMATSVTKFLGSGQHHTCVNGDFSVCQGSHFGQAWNNAISKGDYASAIHMMIDFLKDPNSTNPYVDSSHLLLMQDIPAEALERIKDDSQFFSQSFYRDLPFDQDLYKLRVAQIKDELQGALSDVEMPIEVTSEILF